MKKKNKVLLTSMATIAMCASLVAGGTYALFTSESAVNIAISSATVNVQATIGELTLSSTVDGVTTDGVDGKWVNGGTASVDGDTITLDKMTPGDTVSFDITVTNYSDVAVKARTVYTATGELLGGLIIDGFGEVQNTGVTLWETLEVGSEAEVYSVSITLDEDAGDEYQNKTAAITFGVEAVQGNADVADPFTVSYGDTEETFVSFAAALDCYKNADASDVEITIAEGTYYNTNVVVEQLANKNLTISANGKVTFANNTAATPVLLIDGNGGWNNTETLTFDGLTFDLNNGAYGITFPSATDVRYAHNVTLQNCAFVGTDNTGFGVQCGADASPNAVTVSTCKAEGIDTFVSMYVKTLSVAGCTATNINGFVNNQSAEGTTSLTNCTATVNGKEAGYFARVNGGTLNVTDSTVALESKCAYTTGAIVVRGATNVTLTNNNITATVADGVNGAAATICRSAAGQATVTSDKAYSISDNYKNADNLISVKEYSAAGEKTNEYYGVISAKGLQNLHTWIVNNKAKNFWGRTYAIMADIDATDVEWECIRLSGDSSTAKGFTFNGYGHTISNLTITPTKSGTASAGLFTGATKGIDSDVLTSFNDITFDNVNVQGNSHHNGVIWGEAFGSLTLKNISVVNSTVTGGCNVGALIGRNTDLNVTFTFIDCAVKNTTVTATTLADYSGASAFLGMALRIGTTCSANVIFEGTNVAENNTLDTAAGMQGGGIYTCAEWDTPTWETPEVVNDFTNYNSNN